MNRSTFIQFGAALIFLALLGSGWWWWSARVATTRTNIEALSVSIQEKQIELTRVAAARAELSPLASDNTTINTYFVSESDVVQFLNVINATGRAAGASVSIMSVVPNKKNTKYPMLNVSAKVSGSFGAVMRTVGAIENIPYYVTMNSLSLSTSKTSIKKTHKPLWNAAITLSVGYFSSTTTPIAKTSP